MKKKPSKKVAEISGELRDSLAIERIDAPMADPTPIIVEPTMSNTDRFLTCAFPWGRVATDLDVGEEARFGSALHEALALGKVSRALAKKWGVESFSLHERYHAAKPVLDEWLAGANPWRIDFRTWNLKREIALAYNIEAGTARYCDGPNERHEYLDRLPSEIPGTADILGVGVDERTKIGKQKFNNSNYNTVLILDHKSGWEVGSPAESGQLRSLALAACRIHGVSRAIVAFLHAPRDMGATVYADTLDDDVLRQHAIDLRQANARRGDGSMKPGYHCKWCKVFSVCPTNAPALLELRLKPQLTTAEDVGAAHQKLQEMTKRFSELHSIVDDEIRAWVRKNGAAIRPDGDGVDFVERSYSNLSQQSIIRALGKLKGGKEIERLKRLGAIEVGTRKELRVIK